MKTAEEFTLVLNTREYCVTRTILEKWEFISKEFDEVYKSLESLRAEFDSDEDELKTLRGVLDRYEAELEPKNQKSEDCRRRRTPLAILSTHPPVTSFRWYKTRPCSRASRAA
jgi:hypothetical protein